VRWTIRSAWLFLWLLVGCTAAPPPATTQARTPTPGTVTRDNPGGDAQSPVDAALARLESQPVGVKDDKFRTLRPRLPDAGNWKRIRFFGYPTRAAFRYGKDHYAMTVITYSDAEGDDAPETCLRRFVQEARGLAVRFDVEMGPLEREEHTHPRGIESLDMEEVKAAERAWQKELDKRRKLAREHLAKWRAERALRRARAKEAAAARAARAKQAGEAAETKDEAGPGAAEEAAASDEAATKQASAKEASAKEASAKEAAAKEASAKEASAKEASAKEASAKEASAKEASAKDAAARKPPPTAKESSEAARRRLPLRFRFRGPPRARRLADPALEMWKRAHETRTPMPLVLTSGSQTTLTSRERYLVAIAAYDSWPGTCLVQGLAVQVGTDPALAERVRDRWVREVAPELKWRRQLRATPPFENR
jgi:hypothetical protein